MVILLNISLIGTGKRTKLNPPENVHVQWAEKGSYQLEHMLETISHLPNRNTNMFTQKDYEIYILDNYAVHLQPEIRKALLERGYILVLMGGGITGDLQVLKSNISGFLAVLNCNNHLITYCSF